MNKTIIWIFLILILSSCSAKLPENQTTEIKEEETPKNIILLIGDGMGISQITAAMYSNEMPLNIERFKIVGLQKTHSKNNLVTDSAAGATAFATGKKTNNGYVGVLPNGEAIPNIIELVQEKGLATGIIATSQIAHATPAAFFAHHPKRAEMQTIASQLVDKKIDLLIGGGRHHFEKRKDKRNLSKEMAKNGYQVTSLEEKNFSEMDIYSKESLLYFTAESLPKTVAEGRDYLAPSTEFAMRFLQNKSPNGFFLMVEASQIDWGGHQKNSDYIIDEMLDFDTVIGKALDFAEKDKNTLVIVTSDHETGGYALNYGSTREELQPAFTSDYHTAQMVPVFAFGNGAEAFAGIYDNTEIFYKMVNALGLEVQ